MAVILLSTLTACMYCLFPLSARTGVLPGFHVQTRPSVSVINAWSLLAMARLVFAPSGRLRAVGLVVLSVRYQACPFASSRRNPWLRAWAWTMRTPGFCLTRTGLAFPVLFASQIQACPSASTMRIRLPEARAVMACACPGRSAAVCSPGFAVGSWVPGWLAWKVWTCPCWSTARSRSSFRLMLVNLVFRLVSRMVGVACWLVQV